MFLQDSTDVFEERKEKAKLGIYMHQPILTDLVNTGKTSILNKLDR